MKIRLGKFCRRFFVLLFFFFASIYASIIAHGWLMRHWEKDENNESERGEGWKEILSTVRSLLDISVCRVMSTRFDTFPRLDIFLIVYRYLRSIAGSKYKILPLFFSRYSWKLGGKISMATSVVSEIYIEIRSINFFSTCKEKSAF